jgi:hypothetical protein
MKKLALAIMVLSACGGMAAKDGDTLADSVRQYNDGVRWSRFEVAADHIPPKQRPQWVDDWDQRAKDLKITDYEIVKVEAKSRREAKVQVKVEWYKDSEGKVHETHALQTWERHGKIWLIVDEARLRGTEMPGLQEPVAKDVATEPAIKD